jgi:hypothetical protein
MRPLLIVYSIEFFSLHTGGCLALFVILRFEECRKLSGIQNLTCHFFKILCYVIDVTWILS